MGTKSIKAVEPSIQLTRSQAASVRHAIESACHAFYALDEIRSRCESDDALRAPEMVCRAMAGLAEAARSDLYDHLTKLDVPDAMAPEVLQEARDLYPDAD